MSGTASCVTNMGDVSEASLLDYICSSGGKVKNADLMKTYKQFVSHSDLHLRAKYREDFKLIMDRIAVSKTENGEKYLILKKKYRQHMQEHASEPVASEQRQKTKTHQVEWCIGPTITVTDVQEPDEDVTVDQPSAEKPEPPSEENPEPTDAEDELEKDSGSKSESEQEEESAGSIEPTAVALDPIEKEWIYSAACGRLLHLTHLLKQDASLANKKDFTSTALHWAAKHGKEDMAAAMADAGTDVNIKAGYTPLHIAALHGHVHIFNLLIQTYDAKENVRDYSGHLASHYLNIQKPEESRDLHAGYHSPAQVNERRNRKLASLFHSRKKWGSAEDLATIPEDRNVPHQLIVPAFRPRKFSR